MLVDLYLSISMCQVGLYFFLEDFELCAELLIKFLYFILLHLNILLELCRELLDDIRRKAFIAICLEEKGPDNVNVITDVGHVFNDLLDGVLS